MVEPRWTPPTLTTDRLILRALTLQDAGAIFSYSKNEEVARYTLWNPHQSIADALSFVTDYAFTKYAEQSPEPFGICLKSNPDEVIGTMGCWWISKPYRCMEMGYALSQTHWNQGIASEAAAAVIEYCFQNHDVNRIQAHHYGENARSGRVLEKVGMSLEGTLRQKVFSKGSYWDILAYSILREDWVKKTSFT